MAGQGQTAWAVRARRAHRFRARGGASNYASVIPEHVFEGIFRGPTKLHFLTSCSRGRRPPSDLILGNN